MGVVDIHVRYVHRCVLGNIEATNATRGHIHRYIHTYKHSLGRCHDQCGARSGSPQLAFSVTGELLFLQAINFVMQS